MQSLIRVNKLEKTFDSGGVKTHAVKGVSFKIDKGEFISIMGPSGSGKSTLMQMLGFLDRPTGGNYYFEGKNSIKYDLDELADIRNQKIGFVFQTFNLLARTTVYENVELPLLYYRGSKKNRKKDKEKIEKALESVGLGHRIEYGSNQISGGEKQRVAIARALVNDPEVIFADEPTGNLDSKSGAKIMKILQELNQEGKTVILVTHEVYTAKHARRIIKMVDGEIVKDGENKEREIANGIDLRK
ncbi:MAG: ATP-binding cassette domain-containing protein [Candidatus Moranbacteria bacterium]|nr:ATP-binding cassette domain-containing protein [Candidatus Moranbacteria bacterium]